MENEIHSEEWMKGYDAGRDDGYEVGYQDGVEDGPKLERSEKGEPHSLQNLDARIYRLEQTMAALLSVLGYGIKQ
jgi:flagellar biosynthesis/type III secretory pathway protein FliH